MIYATSRTIHLGEVDAPRKCRLGAASENTNRAYGPAPDPDPPSSGSPVNGGDDTGITMGSRGTERS